jgi:tetratricopeptide (TPR) repeat protein
MLWDTLKKSAAFAKIIIRNSFAACCLVAVSCGVAAQADFQPVVADLGHRWATINYQMPMNEQAAAFDALAKTAAQAATTFPQRAEPLIWQATILVGQAKAEHNLGALEKVKLARQLLLDAEKIDPKAFNGSIYALLGSLYGRVPGWPLAFGDKQKAVDYFKKALAINPDNIDTNYYYADFLSEQGNYAGAVEYLQKSLAAPARPGREDADAGRRQEAQQMLDALRREHGAELHRT